MRTHVTTYIWVLGIFSLVAVIVGIGTIATAFTTTYSRVDDTTDVLSKSLEEMEQVVGVLNARKSELRELGDVPSRIEATMRDLPQLTEASSEALAATTETVDKTANLVEAVDGRGDFILGGSPLKESAAALRENSKALRVLHERMTEAQATLEETVAESTQALQAATSIGKELRGSAPRLGELEERVHKMRQMSDSGILAVGAAGMQAMVGGLYLLIGLLLGGLATHWSQLERRRFYDR